MGPVNAISEILPLLNGIPTWEPDAYVAFLIYLPRCTHYIDFGTWVGTTLFYAAQMVDMAIGIEADPVAYALVSTNLALNNDKWWAAHTFIQPGAIREGSTSSVESIQTTMSSSAPGNSCSGMNGLLNGDCDQNDTTNSSSFEWNVNAYTLPAIFAHYQVPENEKTFIKIDVESYECYLLPSWLEWLSALPVGRKPTLRVEFHHMHPNLNDQGGMCLKEQYLVICEIASLYRRTYSLNDPTKDLFLLENGTFQQLQDVIFTDI